MVRYNQGAAMRMTTPTLTISGAILLFFLSAAPSAAQATRTWVSGVGDDANPCSRTAPCKTFAGAISKTAAGGEIDALDPGGFGAVTITKAITLAAEGAGEGGIVVAGTNGINVVAGANDVVILRGLQIDGGPPGSNSLNGVKFNTGAVLEIRTARFATSPAACRTRTASSSHHRVHLRSSCPIRWSRVTATLPPARAAGS